MLFNATGEGGRDLFLLDLTTAKVTRVAKTRDDETAPSFSPDGQQIVYSAGVPADRANHIFVVGRDGSHREQLTDNDSNDTSAQFSPDGKTIVFARDKTYNWGGLAANWELGGVICVMDADGGNLRELTSDKEFAASPQFSAGGRCIEYSTGSGRMSIPVDGSADPTPIAGPAGAVTSPDGQPIVYTKGKYSPDLKVCVASADGTSESVLTPEQGGCHRPVFTPSGDRIYFLREEWPHGATGRPKFRVWQVDVDGNNPCETADRKLFDDPLQWKQ